MTKQRQDIRGNEGRPNEDLNDCLQDDMVNKSRDLPEALDSIAAASGDYFQREVICNLAEEDLSVMGASFKK